MREFSEFEHFVGTDHDEIIQLRLERLKNTEICKKLILNKREIKSIKIEDSFIEEKAEGLSSTIESILGYLNIMTKELNVRILTRYYALLQLTIAEEVASISNTNNLKSIQKHTEMGHGLATINNFKINENINNLYCYILKQGHFYHYLKHRKLSYRKKISYERRILKIDSENNSNLISLVSLLRSIPELNEIIEEYLDVPPLSIRIGHAGKNISEKSKKLDEYLKKTGEFVLEVPETNEINKTTHIVIYPTKMMDIEYLKNLDTPFSEFEYSPNDVMDDGYPICKFIHPKEGQWFDHLQLYKSSYCGTTYICPILNKINDPILIHYMLLYTLSIVVRYLPSFWYEITKGTKNYISNLINYYISIFDHLLPKLMLERITEKTIHISMPGGWDAPV